MSQIQVATFQLGTTLWGIKVLQIREVIKLVQFTAVPQAPEVICGLMNLRGQIVTAVDLARCVGTETSATGALRHCVILKTDSELRGEGTLRTGGEATGQDPVGLVVDAVGDVVAFEEGAVDSVPANASVRDSRFVRGVLRLEDELLLLLALTPVLELAHG